MGTGNDQPTELAKESDVDRHAEGEEVGLASLPLSALRPLAPAELARDPRVLQEDIPTQVVEEPVAVVVREGAAIGPVVDSTPEPSSQLDKPEQPPVMDAGDNPASGQPNSALQEAIKSKTGHTITTRLQHEPDPAPTEPAPFELPLRYRWLASLGEGGQGTVELVLDRDLGRTVALKTLHLHKNKARHLLDLYREARITGQLEHPHVIPIYDAGQLPDGRLYYTMPRLPGESLHHVLSQLRQGQSDALRRWGLVPLIQVLEKACHGIASAHARGVIHRDIKPANILLGRQGEVLVVDWGIARIFEGMDEVARRLWSEPGDARVERVRGSPPYMAPEQVKHPDQAGPAADVFCLGVILYEILTRVPPFFGANLDDVVEALCHERPVPPRERAPDLSIPAELEEVCLRALEKFPGHRYANASELASELGDFLAGGRRREAASRRLREAESLRARYRVLARRKEEAAVERDQLRQPIGTLDEQNLTERAHEMEQRVASLERAADAVFSEAVWALHRALADDPQSRETQTVLGELYGDRYAEAEWLGADREQAFFRAMLRQFDDGRWGRWLRSGARMTLESVPEDVPLGVYRLREVGATLVPGELLPPDGPGTWNLAPGRYAIAPEPAATDDDPEPSLRWFYPIALQRDDHRHVLLDLRGEDLAGDHFSFIPGGPAGLGGDPLAAGSAAPSRPMIPPFAIGRHPVTVGAYTRFLDWLEANDPVEARIRTPIGIEDIHRIDERRPVTGLSHDDALAYCDWLRGATGVVLRLPTADEWEKSARGADGRIFPWGDRFDPALCSALGSSQTTTTPPDVGSRPGDCSPFGMQGSAGGVWEWTSTADGDRQQVVMGGAIISEPSGCRSATRRSIAAETKLHFLGFRVVLELD